MTTSISVGHSPPLHVEIRHVAASQPIEWLRRGWDDFRAIGLPGLAHGALISILGAVLLMLGSSHLYFTAAAVTGYLLVGPVMTTGLCELARRRSAHEPMGFDESLSGLRRNPEGLTHFGAILALIALLWFGLSAILLEDVLRYFDSEPCGRRVGWLRSSEPADNCSATLPAAPCWRVSCLPSPWSRFP